MKRILPLLIFAMLVASCSNDTTITPIEAEQVVALKSTEFKALQSSYKVYNDYKMGEIRVMMANLKSGKTSREDHLLKKEEYVQRCAELIKAMADKGKLFREKYPRVVEHMGASHLMETLHNSIRNDE